jgi:hypothetical protein
MKTKQQNTRIVTMAIYRRVIAIAFIIASMTSMLHCHADVKSDFVNPPIKFRSMPLWFWNNTNVTAAEVEAQPQGPEGYTYCAREGGTYTLSAKSHVAYGANGHFNYLYNQTGTIRFGAGTFGDPTPGVVKSGFYKIADGSESTTNLSAAMKKIKDHLTGTSSLTTTQINQQAQIIQENIFLMGANDTVMTEAFDIVNFYETNSGPIFINDATKGGFPNNRGASDGYELVRAVFIIQQAIHDEAFTAENLEKYLTLLDGKQFKTAEFFPGACAAPTTPDTTYTVKINASMSAEWGKRTAFSSTPARRPTGYYLAPGSIGTVTVPKSMVNKGFKVLVGAHTWDKTGSSLVRRFGRVCKTFPITKTVTPIANPFGGGIYIVTPYEADLGILDVQITNAVPSPFFSAKPWHQTTLHEWQNIQRKNRGPWADFESEKFMMQVPTSWVYNFDDPVTLMENWDKAMDGVSELLGYPLVRNNVVLYVQVDVSIMYYYFCGIGYPQVNETYNPASTFNGNHDHWFLRNPIGGSTEYHELGHAQLFSAFPEDYESAVHLLGTYAANEKFGMDLNSAFNNYCAGEQGIWRLDRAAQYWMARDNFIAGNNMGPNELNYEHTGHAKYVDMVRLFSWDILKRFYYQEQLDHINNTPSDGLHVVDSLILKLSTAAHLDLTPLLDFWGCKPQNATQLRDAIAAANLPPSEKIYDQLLLYKSIIPGNNAEFRTFIATLYPSGSNSNSDGTWGWLWMTSIADRYDENYAKESADVVQRILDIYFPDGRPQPHTMPTGPEGYKLLGKEDQTVYIHQTSSVAYGLNGQYNYQDNVTGQINLTNAVFGDPIPGVVKYAWYKVCTNIPAQPSAITGNTTLHDLFD